jgi:hypothetical protein
MWKKPIQYDETIILDCGALGERGFRITGEYYPGEPAILSGPPEVCCEATPAEAVILSVEMYLSPAIRVFLPYVPVDTYRELLSRLMHRIEGERD